MTSKVVGFPKGSFSVCPADDFVESDPAWVAVLLNLGPEANSSKVLAVVGVAGICWEAVVDAGMGIGVVGSVASVSGTTLSITDSSVKLGPIVKPNYNNL